LPSAARPRDRSHPIGIANTRQSVCFSGGCHHESGGLGDFVLARYEP